MTSKAITAVRLLRFLFGELSGMTLERVTSGHLSVDPFIEEVLANVG